MDRDHRRADKLGQQAMDERRLRHRRRKQRIRLEREQLAELKELIEAEVGGRPRGTSPRLPRGNRERLPRHLLDRDRRTGAGGRRA